MTMPTGFVKSTIHAPSGACSAISSTTGTVRRALARPPAPVVSRLMQPQGEGLSSSRRALWPPTRTWTSTKSAPSRAGRSSSVTTSSPRYPCRWSILRAIPDTTEPLTVDVVQGDLAHLQPREAGDELVGRPRLDHRELHTFTRSAPRMVIFFDGASIRRRARDEAVRGHDADVLPRASRLGSERRLVFVVGAPRSGTTFLAGALGTLPGFVDLGEVAPSRPRFPASTATPRRWSGSARFSTASAGSAWSPPPRGRADARGRVRAPRRARRLPRGARRAHRPRRP